MQPSASMTVAQPLSPLVILDNRWRMAGWQYCVNHDFHDANGNPVVNKVSDWFANDGSLSQVSSCWQTRFPDMTAMTAQAHSKGVKMGWVR